MSDMDERKTKMLEMRKSGATYAEIGKAFNVTRQRVYILIGGQTRGQFKEITSEDCIYPNLRKWMNDNRISIAEFTRRVYGSREAQNYSDTARTLKGVGRDMRKSTIDKYLATTGLTYEKFFEIETKTEETKPTEEGDYFTPAEVRGMTAEEVKANYAKIITSMSRWH